MMRLNVCVFAAALLAAGCSSDDNAAKPCKDNLGCTDGKVCIEGTCQEFIDCEEIYKTPNACSLEQTCTLTASGAACVTVGCRVSSECPAGQFCTNGECGARPTTAVASCEILNSQRVFASAASVEIHAAAYDANGRYLPHQEFTVTSGNAAAFTTTGRSLVAVANTTGAPLTSDITVSFGGTTCPAVSFTNLPALVAGKTRLTLYKTAASAAVGSAPIGTLEAEDIYFTDSSGTRIEVGPSLVIDQINGVYMFDTNASAVAVTVADADHSFATVYWGASTAAHDYALPLEPIANKKGDTNGFAGTPDFTAYDAVQPPLQAPLALAYAGGSLPLTALLNFNLSLFAGDTANFATAEFLGLIGATQSCATPRAADGAGTIPLPRALYIANGAGAAIGPNCNGYAARVAPGRRIGWSLGVKLPFDALGGFIAPGASLSIDTIIATLLPLADRITLGVDVLTPSYLERKPATLWEAFAVKAIGSQQNDADFHIANVKPANKLVNIVNFAHPGTAQDFFTGATSDDKLTGFISLIAAVSPAYGIVPVGFGAGFDAKNAAGESTPDGQLDRLRDNDARFVENTIHTRHTVLPAEVADNDVIGLLIGANFQDLFKGSDDATKKSKAVRLKGLVNRNREAKIGWTRAAGTLGDMATAVEGYNAPNNPTYALVANKITLPTISRVDSGAAAKMVIIRLDRGDNASERAWNIIIDPAAVQTASTGLVLNTHGMTELFEGTEPALDLAIISLDMNDTQSFEGRLSPAYGKDIELIAGDTKSFAVYLDQVTPQ